MPALMTIFILQLGFEAPVAKAAEEKLPTRIVFLGYFDLLWPPTETKIMADNAIFMYAPVSRCYRHPLNDPKCDDRSSYARPELNACQLPSTNRAYAEIAQL